MKYLNIVLLLLMVQLKAAAQEKSAGNLSDFDKVANSFLDYQATRPVEKIHVQFDRVAYNAGDTAWFKIYLVDGANNHLSGNSKIVYLDIAGPKKFNKKLVLPVNMGMASGQLELTDSIFKSGNYTVRGYTNLMRNYGAAYYFNHTFKVSGPEMAKTVVPVKDKNIKQAPGGVPEDVVHIDFFPEGGNLVNGIRSKIGFKALNNNGLGATVKGRVENQRKEIVAYFETGHAGMGAFTIMPQGNDIYTAVVTEGKYKDQRFPMPAAKPQGYVLSLGKSGKDKILVKINRSKALLNEPEVRLLVQGNGELLHQLRLKMADSALAFTLPMDQFKGGINQVTLFSADNTPMAERLIFVRDTGKVITTLSTDKQEYGTRDKVMIRFSGVDKNNTGVVGGYSAAVTLAEDAGLQEEYQQSILSNLLLTSDLKGNIEAPNYYFSNVTDQKDLELDVLMLTQGWRKFNWTEVLSAPSAPPKYTAEKGINISGKVTTLSGKPLAGVPVKLFSAKDLLFLDTLSDADGRFLFKNIVVEGTAQVILRAVGAKGGNNAKIQLDEVPDYKLQHIDSIPSMLIVSRDEEVTDNLPPVTAPDNPGKITQGKTIKTVNINAKKRPEIKGSVYPFAASPPDYVLEQDKLQEMESLESWLKGRFLGVMINQFKVIGYCKGIPGPMVILLNGMEIEDLSGISPKALTGVEIIKGSIISSGMAQSLMIQGLYGSACNGIVFLTMKGVDAKYIKTKRPAGMVQQEITGYTFAREFYAPKYDVQKTLPKYDERVTLCWKPDLITSKAGTADFSFYTADGKGTYKVTVEGVGAAGQLTRKIAYFEVK